MKPIYALILILILLLSGCTQNNPANQPSGAEPTDVLDLSEATLMALLEPTATQTASPAPPTETPASAETPEEGELAASPTSETATEVATEEPAPTEEPPTPLPTDTPLPPTPSSPPIDPNALFGNPRFIDDFSTGDLWLSATGLLPNTGNIEIQEENGRLQVTGKNQEFDTWWLSVYSMGAIYIELDANSGDCSGDESYGLFVHGAPQGEPGRGYIIGITCDGRYFVRRVDGITPSYISWTLLVPTASPLINSGADQENRLGIWIENGEIEIYINDYYVSTIYDATYDYGRYGLFVNSGTTDDYSFYADHLQVWDLTR